jgi:hypothetical protein
MEGEWQNNAELVVTWKTIIEALADGKGMKPHCVE